MLSKIDTALLAYLHELIIKGRAGMPSEIAKRLGIGERTLYRYLKRLKDMEGSAVLLSPSQVLCLYKRMAITYSIKKMHIPKGFCIFQAKYCCL
jgi:DNA-binding Lrp family transcriptional regulator